MHTTWDGRARKHANSQTYARMHTDNTLTSRATMLLPPPKEVRFPCGSSVCKQDRVKPTKTGTKGEALAMEEPVILWSSQLH